MSGLLDRAALGMLFAFDPETAHGLSIKALKCGLVPSLGLPRDQRLEVTVAGLNFPNPLGMAAGYDKNAEVPDALLALGFGFAEVGTITPRPQAGNERPRIFRLAQDEAVINRLGFNNEGHAEARKRLVARAGNPGLIGVNIGANKDSADRIDDYVRGVHEFAPLASYLTVNISSPNTPGLRLLQSGENLNELLSRIAEARQLFTERRVPIFLKIAPDLEDADIEAIADGVKKNGFDGIIISNTTLSRKGLSASRNASEAGGLSGKPLFVRSTVILAKTRELAGPDLPLIGVGGVDSAEKALEKIRAGANLVQLYTGMIFRGPLLPRQIVKGMRNFLDKTGIPDISAIRDTRAKHWANMDP
jgi:dihydroorotate dehydrogenase